MSTLSATESKDLWLARAFSVVLHLLLLVLLSFAHTCETPVNKFDTVNTVTVELGGGGGGSPAAAAAPEPEPAPVAAKPAPVTPQPVTKPTPQPASKPVRNPVVSSRQPSPVTTPPPADPGPSKEELERQRQEQAAKEALGGVNLRKQPGSGSGGSGDGSGGGSGPDKGPSTTPGSGSALRGFGNRGVLSRPKVTENVQNNATVVVRICVNPQGNVVSAVYTISGSEGAVPTLVSIAERNARSWKFEPVSGGENQCGSIVYRFSVQ